VVELEKCVVIDSYAILEFSYIHNVLEIFVCFDVFDSGIWKETMELGFLCYWCGGDFFLSVLESML